MTPSESYVAAADAPIPVLRAHLGTFARVLGPLVLVSQLAMVPSQLAQGWVQAAPPGTAMLGRMMASVGLSLGGAALFFVLYPLGQLVIYAVADDLLEGREPGLLPALRRAARPTVWATALGVTLVASMGMFAMGVGYGIALGFLGFALPILLIEGVGPVEALRRSVYVATFGAGLQWWRAPWTRVAVAVIAWWGLTSAVGVLGAFPMWISMGWRMWDAFAHGGDVATAAQASPIAVVLSAVLGAAGRILTDGYICLVTLLVYRDVRRRMAGEDVERAVAALEAGR